MATEFLLLLDLDSEIRGKMRAPLLLGLSGLLCLTHKFKINELIEWKTNTKYLIGSSSSSELLSRNFTTGGFSTSKSSSSLTILFLFSLRLPNPLVVGVGVELEISRSGITSASSVPTTFESSGFS